jgi:sulfotransferase
MENQSRKLFFLIALPRSGNTLFTSIINQNPEIACTANSVTLEIMKNLYLIKQTDTFQNFPDQKSLDNVLDNVYDLYYKDWPQRIIIDRGPVMTSGAPGNFELMQQHFKPGFKCIVLLRDLMEVFASYMQWYTENLNSFVNKLGKNDEEKLLALMNKDGAIVKEIKSIQTAYKYPKMCHFIKYDDMVANPEQEFRKIYKFIDEPYFNHRFIDLDQLQINKIKYNDSIVGKNMHTIKTGEIMKEYNPYIEKIPQRIRDKYEHIRF